MKPERAKRFADDTLGFITLDEGICNSCQHVNEDGQSCKAFSGGIPIDILRGKVDHTKPYPGDNDIQYEARET